MNSQLPFIAQALSAFLTPVIALAVAYVAYWQYETALTKLSLELFEKRLAIYERVSDAVRIVNGSGRVDEEADRLLLEAMNASQFLFGDDIHIYLDTMWKRFSRMRVAQSQTESDHQATRETAISAQSQLFQEITRFYQEGADVFADYMRMSHKLPRSLRMQRRRR